MSKKILKLDGEPGTVITVPGFGRITDGQELDQRTIDKLDELKIKFEPIVVEDQVKEKEEKKK